MLNYCSEQRDALSDVPNALGYQRILETSTNGYLVRQYLYSSLYDRLRYTVRTFTIESSLTLTVPDPSWKILNVNGWHSSFCVDCEIAMLAMSTTVISRRRISL